jgi:ankyrin repeat protein
MNADVQSDLQSILRKYAEMDMFSGYDIVSPESPGPDGDTPFHMIAYDGDVEAAKIMLPYISDINFGGDIGNSPLHYAVLNDKFEMARFLILNGADRMKKNDYGDTSVDFMEGKDEFHDFL